MQLGAVTYNVLKDWDLEKIITTLEASGFHGVELRTEHAHKIEPGISAEERERVKQRFAKSKIRLVSFGTTCEFHSPDQSVRRKQVETARTFIDLAHDTGAWGIKVRPNGLPKEVSVDQTIANIAACLKELGEYGAGRGVEIYLEVHGRETQNPQIAETIMRATNHKSVGLCWNSNPTDVINGSIRTNFHLLRPWIKNVHINELAGPYPYR
ncbi:MAG TPA: TIM barrel protein, partial [Bryobacteraceae bacterium]|nr:TIM barrel protein [Bryobacteraceae bacterium]